MTEGRGNVDDMSDEYTIDPRTAPWGGRQTAGTTLEVSGNGRSWARYGGPAERYRYELGRVIDAGPFEGRTEVLWIMLNPSIATAVQDDPTIRRVVGYSEAWGFRWARVVNLYGLRDTDPRRMLRHPYPTGDPINRGLIVEHARHADLVVCAWGNHGGDRGTEIAEQLLAEGVRLHALAVTARRQPSHPLRLRAELSPRLWAPGIESGQLGRSYFNQEVQR